LNSAVATSFSRPGEEETAQADGRVEDASLIRTSANSPSSVRKTTSVTIVPMRCDESCRAPASGPAADRPRSAARAHRIVDVVVDVAMMSATRAI
jgi:hypothetical protein